jgi:hypothetical protein
MLGTLGVVGRLWVHIDHVDQSAKHVGNQQDPELRRRHQTLRVLVSSHGWGSGFGGTTA